MASLCAGCDRRAAPPLAPSDAGPLVRVLLKRASLDKLPDLTISGEYRLFRADGREFSLAIRSEPAPTLAGGDDGVKWNGASLGVHIVEIRPEPGALISLNGKPYRGALRLIQDDQARLAFINVVPLETYLTGLIRGEVPRRFGPAAQRALAVAARTYALFHLNSKPDDADYHLGAGEGSQVYRGARGEDAAAIDAVRRTRGVVLAGRDGERFRIFETFYSSTCGGATQSAKAFAGRGFLEPLRGDVICRYCESAGSPYLRWNGPRYTKQELTRRLRRAYPSLEPLGRIERIATVERGAAGRPTAFELFGRNNRSRTLRAEELRVGLRDRRLKSAWFHVESVGGAFRFIRGRGFGHGVGLCQYGTDGLARTGKTTSEILTYYYPESRLVRAY